MKLIAVVVVVIASSLAGCGTYAARMDGDRHASNADYYKATATDFDVLGFEWGYASMYCYMSIICPIAVLASIPVDLAVDTLLLPYDYSRADIDENITHAQAKAGENLGFIKFDFSGSSNLLSAVQSIGYWVRYTNGTKKAVSLYVKNPVVVDASLMAYIPVLKGYMPSSVWMYRGGSYEINFVFLSGDAASPISNRLSQDWLYSNKSTFVLYDGGQRDKVLIVPFINYPNVKFSAAGGWAPSAHAY